MMIASMEILSIVTRTDFGAGPKQKAAQDADRGFRFDKIFEDAQSKPHRPINNNSKQTETKSKDAEMIDYEDKPEVDKDDVSIAASMMGIHENVVFILEGDMESVTTPEMFDDVVITDGAADTDAVIPEDTTQTPVHNEPVSEENVQFAAYVKDAENNTKNTENVALTADETDYSAGEVTARKPIIRTSEQQESDKEQSSGFSENGDLGPLENENDAVPKTERKEKTYSETSDAAQNTADDVVNNVPPPLSEGIRPERFQADQQMKQVTHAPVSADNLFDEMVSRIEMARTETQQTMTIQLKPEFLGKVALEIAMDAAGLHVKINAADPGVRGMINGQINALIESLENKGIEVVAVEVAYTGVDNGDLKDPRGGHHAQPGRSKRISALDDIDNAEIIAAFTTETLEHYLEAGVSTVEYSA